MGSGDMPDHAAWKLCPILWVVESASAASLSGTLVDQDQSTFHHGVASTPFDSQKVWSPP